MAKPATARLTDKVMAGLIGLIDKNGLGPGDKLPTSQQLCELFGVSRTVVREATARLEAEGRLTSRRGSGVYVKELDLPLTHSLVVGSPQDLADVLEIMELRMSVEIEAAALAAQRRSETDILRLEQAMARFGRHMQDRTLASDADRALHQVIAEATGNLKFKHFVDEIGDRLIPRRALGAAFANPDDQTAFLQKIHDEHKVIVDAIIERNEDAARTAMRSHLENGRRRYRTWSVEHPEQDWTVPEPVT